jgi:membrane protein YqaA with SNARE-associated domain
MASERLQRTWRWLHDAADRGWSATAVFVYGVLQSLIVPGLSDAFFLPLSLAQPRRAWRLALVAGAGTLLGASLLYTLGTNVLAVLGERYGAWLGVTPDGFARVHDLLTDYGWLLIVGSTFSPISLKLLAASAGAFGMPYPLFVAALGVSRFTRVFVLAWAIRKFGARAVRESLGLDAVGDEDEPARGATDTRDRTP